MGVALFWLLPEMAEFLGWPAAAAWIGGGRRRCGCWTAMCIRSVRRALPLTITPIARRVYMGLRCLCWLRRRLHSALDGWTVMAGQSHPSLGPALLFGIAAHKAPGRAGAGGNRPRLADDPVRGVELVRHGAGGDASRCGS